MCIRLHQPDQNPFERVRRYQNIQNQQTPSGIPVATVAINGGANAALLAVKMLAINDDALLEKLEKYSEELKAGVEKKDAKLAETGYRNYTK